MRVLLVCTGNINRSAAAHVILATQHPDWRVTSAATNGKAGRPMARRMRLSVAAAGYDPSTHQSTALTPDLIADADWHIGFQPSHLIAIAALGGIPHLATALAPGYQHLPKVPDPAFDPTGAAHDLTINVARALAEHLPTLGGTP